MDHHYLVKSITGQQGLAKEGFMVSHADWTHAVALNYYVLLADISNLWWFSGGAALAFWRQQIVDR
jgi:hypothetical protein